MPAAWCRVDACLLPGLVDSHLLTPTAPPPHISPHQVEQPAAAIKKPAAKKLLKKKLGGKGKKAAAAAPAAGAAPAEAMQE